MKSKEQLVNSAQAWDANRRYKVNTIVTYGGSDWQNTTGKNSVPGVGSDWVNTKNVPTLQEVVTAGNIITDGTPIILQNGSTNRLILQTDSVSAESASDGLISTLNAGSLIFIDYINSKAVSFSPISIGGNGQILLPDVINETVILTVSQEVTTNTNAINYCKYIANGTITFTDPTPETNKGYIVHVLGGTSTIGGVGYKTGALVYRFYDGSSWISKNYGVSISDDYPNDVLADAGGIPIGGLYHTSGVVKIRLT